MNNEKLLELTRKLYNELYLAERTMASPACDRVQKLLHEFEEYNSRPQPNDADVPYDVKYAIGDAVLEAGNAALEIALQGEQAAIGEAALRALTDAGYQITKRR